MAGEQEATIYAGTNCIEVQYYFDEQTHLMDALIQNKCEYELLALIKEVALRFKLGIHIETAPLAEKGFRWRFKIALKKENKTGPLAITAAATVFVAVMASPLAAIQAIEAKKLIEQIVALPDFVEEKKRAKLQVEKRIEQLLANADNLDTSNIIKKRRSNFYELLNRYAKVNRVQLTAINESGANPILEKTIPREDFARHIVTTDVLEPETLNDIEIEVVTPVLKKSNYKWVGIYNGKPRAFTMISKEFKKLVQSGKVQFKNGTAINCQITVHKKINSEGVERITATTIDRVNHYYESDRPVETNEGKKQKKLPEPEITQLALFG